MIKNILSLGIFLLGLLPNLAAQIQTVGVNQVANPTGHAWCLSDKVNQEHVAALETKYNNQITKINSNSTIAKGSVKNFGYLPSPSSFATGTYKGAVRTIPIVVHVVHNPANPAENVSDAVIYDMLNTLNETFRAQNANIANVRPAFIGDTADTRMEFCLASKDPLGAATTGITRTTTSEDYFDPDTETTKMKDDATGGKTGWPSSDYLNVWICNISNGAGFGTAGFAYLPTPGMHGSAIDGLVLDYDIGIGPGSTTATHEIGHYMGLNHTWGPAESCSNDDGFADTPDCGGPNYFCPTNANSCGTPNGDQIENFMDYADCAYMFTNDQSTFMNNILSTTRSSLLASDGCEPVAPPVVDFSGNPITTVVNGNVQFTDLSTGIPNNWTWSISPATHNYVGGSSANSQNPLVQFTATGFYDVTLTASNSLGSGTETKTAYIEVVNPAVCAGGIFCEDFSGGALPTGWTATSNSAQPDNWIWSNTGPQGNFSFGPIASTTAADGYMLFDSDLLCSGDQNADLQTPPIDCGTSPGVILEFEQYYVRFADSTLLYVSNDGVNWDQYPLNTTLALNASTANPDLVSVDISATAAFQSTVYVRWRFWSPSGSFGGNEGCGYSWMIDDVLLREPPQYDAAAASSLQEYNLIPFLQSDPIDLQLAVTNEGWDDVTNVSATVNVYDEFLVPVSSNTTNTVALLASGTSTVLSVAGGFSPADTGIFYNEYIVSIAEADGDVSNDTIYSSYYVNDTIYSKDNLNTFDGTLNLTGATNICANKFEVQATDYLNSITALLFADDIGDNFTLEVYNMAGGVPTGAPIASSSTYALTAADTSGGFIFLTLPINGGPSMLTPGDYAIALNDQTGNGNVRVGLTASYFTPNSSFLDYNGGGWTPLEGYSIFDSWVLRANFVSCEMVFNESSTPTSCTSCDGTASVAPTGAIAPYSYTWLTSPTQSSATASNLCEGTYQVVINDARGCERGTQVQVLSSGGTIVLSTSVTPENCGSSDGTATAVASGGTGSYSYAWNGTSQTTQTITGLIAGTYVLTVTDGNGCTAETDFFSNAVVGNYVPTITITGTSTDEVCAGSNGTATAVALGGTSSYTYLWDSSTGGQIGGTATGLASGNYGVTATDVNGCSGSSFVSVANNPGSYTITNTCGNTSSIGGSDGTSTVIPSSGTTPYTYTWSPAPATGQNTATATGLIAGNYFVTVIDGNGCIAYSDCTVNDPSCSLTASSAVSDEVCTGSNGSITITMTGGVSAYTYSWDASAGSQSATSGVATGLAANTYAVTITDAAGCVTTTAATVGSSAGTLSVTNTCNPTSGVGTSDGSSTATISGGTAPYSYAWSPSPASTQTTATVTGLNAGSYGVTVTDNNGCIASNFCVVTSPGCSISVTSTTNAATCSASDGSATVVPTGGSAPYGFSWSTNAGTQSNLTGTATGLAIGVYFVTIADPTFCVTISSVTVSNTTGSVVATTNCSPTSAIGNSDGSATTTGSGGAAPYNYNWSPAPAAGQSGATATGLPTGNYFVTITDANGCSAVDNCSVSDPGCAVTATLNSTGTSCAGACDGTASSSITGGSSPYTFSWSVNAGAQSTSSGNATGLCAGTYVVTVIDNNSCPATATVIINDPAPLLVSYSSTDESCGLSDGTATLNVSGGTTPYVYAWPSGTSTNVESGLTAGSYQATVSDFGSCSDTLTIVINDSGGITGSITPDTSICQGQTMLLTATGGTSYTWNTGETTSFILVSTGGLYNCSVSNGGACVDVVSTSVSVNPIPTPTISASDDTICPGYPVTLTASGASSYTWTPTLQTGSQIVVYPSPSQPVYSVIGDNNGCVGTPVPIQINFYSPLPSAVASSNVTSVPVGGTVTFDGTGSVADQFSWDFDGNSTTDATTISGSYTYNSSGIYDAVLTASLSSGICNSTDTITILVGNVGISDVASENMIEVYPNPTSGKLNLDYELISTNTISIDIYNSIGERVYQTTLSDIKSGKHIIDLANNARGIYFVSIHSDKDVITHKITLVE